jgi:hypothetical protein
MAGPVVILATLVACCLFAAVACAIKRDPWLGDK